MITSSDHWDCDPEPFPVRACLELAAYALALILLSALAFRLSPLGNVPTVPACRTATQTECVQTLDTGH